MGGTRARRGATATSQTQRRAWEGPVDARGRAGWGVRRSFLASLGRLGWRGRAGGRLGVGRSSFLLGSDLADRWPLEREALGVVDEPIEDGIGEGRLADDL